MIKKFFQKNDFWFGAILALITPVIVFVILFYTVIYLNKVIKPDLPLLRQITVQILAVFSNLFIYIKYLKSSDFEKTSKGILIVTFILVIVNFAYKWLFL